MRRFLLSAATLMAAVGCTDVAVDDTLVMEPASSTDAPTIYANVAAPAQTRFAVDPEIGESINNVGWNFRWEDNDKMSTWSNGTAVTKLNASTIDLATYTDETGAVAPFKAALHAGATQFRFVYPANTVANKVTENTNYIGYGCVNQNSYQTPGIGLVGLGDRAMMISDIMTYEAGQTFYQPTMTHLGTFVQFRTDIVNGDPEKEYKLLSVKIGTDETMMQLPVTASVDMTKAIGEDGFITTTNGLMTISVINGAVLTDGGREYLRTVVFPFSVAAGDQTAITFTYEEIGDGETKIMTSNAVKTFDYAADYLAGTHNGIIIECDAAAGVVSTDHPWAGLGTIDNPYLISDEEDLFALEARTVNVGSNNFNGKYFLMTNDITLTKPWEPIGYKDSEKWERDISFGGVFDGGNHSIYGLNVDKSAPIGVRTDGKGDLYESAGLFALVHGTGTVQNLTVYGVVKGFSRAGGITGHANGNIVNCTNYATVSSQAVAGGIAGQSNLTITKCANYGDVTGATNVGGIVAVTNRNVSSCTNAGTITGTASNTGGIVGVSCPASVTSAEAIISRSTNTGTVNGVANVGGIIGYAQGKTATGKSKNSVINRVINTGDITATGGLCGGIAGNNQGVLYNAINSGTINGVSKVGGINGSHTKNTNAGGFHYNIVNLGDVTGTTLVAGIAGEAKQRIYNVINFGTVTATDAAGVAGEILGNLGGPASIVTNGHYFNGQVTATTMTNQTGKGGTITTYDNIEALKAEAQTIVDAMNATALHDYNACWSIESELPTIDVEGVSIKDMKNGAVKGENAITGATVEWRDVAYTTWGGGNGTEEFPYQISNQFQFARLIALVNDEKIDFDGVYFYLMANMGMAGYIWETVGSAEFPFKGMINFNEKFINNIALEVGGQYTSDMNDIIYAADPETQFYGNSADLPYAACSIY